MKKDHRERLRGFSKVTRDITDRKKAQEDLIHLARHDHLTGLANRAVFRDQLDGAITRSDRSGQMAALLFVDLDRFKDVNDTLGHDAGDLLLLKVARFISGSVRGSDTVARLGGDEFGVVLENCSGVQDAAVVERKILDALDQPMMLNTHEVVVTTSIGIAMYPDSDVESIVTDADAAMYAAKEGGRNTFQFHTPQMNVKAFERMVLESGLEDDEFVLHYQPKVDLASGRIIGAEALLRWRRPDLGLVYPTKFVSVLEDTGMIVAVGEWVLRSIYEQTEIWREEGLVIPRVAANISARQFNHNDLVGSVSRILEETGAPRNRWSSPRACSWRMRKPTAPSSAASRPWASGSPSTTSASATRPSPTSNASPSTT